MARLVQERFPDREAEIHALYLSSPEFRALCHDFGVCVENIEQLSNSDDFPSESAQQRLDKVRELESELEAEIVEQLNAALTTPGQTFQQRKEKHFPTDSDPS